MQKPALRFSEYTAVNAVAFAGNVGIAWALVEYIDMHYLVATVIGFFFQTTTAFFVNKEWTFHKHNLRSIRGLSMTTFVQASALSMALAGTALGVEIFGLSFLAARIVSGVLAGLVGYMMDSKFTFHVSPLH